MMKKTYVPSYKKIKSDASINKIINEVVFQTSLNDYNIHYRYNHRIREIEEANKAIREDKEWD